MPICPNQHAVDDGIEYCEECGSRVATSTLAPPPAPASAPPSPSADLMWSCGACGVFQSTSRYCEACGEPNPAHPDYIDDSTDEIPEQSRAPEPPPPPPEAPAPPRQWTVVASADRVFFDRMRSHDGPDATNLRFPAVYPPRTFTLDAEQVFIGRRSRSRGIDPDIDLSAAPEDSGVSHAHAALISTPEGLSVVDVGSSNGTYVNGADEPITPNAPVPLKDGDRVQLGAWTTLTVHYD
ncbi:MAG TPA: FHA domain-containing protein [Stackebrandtia sp.]|uniref:FHA domain-containing protein n=1 Tax=Stackebrandtia sp. TaxID=2023065 RepID=UPI002D290CC3|nr:FHA domain-containing protein [Stackebrandtia sp.]HZE37858.1 FHA domain-containing protein [Stackebrandtia sp.]